MSHYYSMHYYCIILLLCPIGHPIGATGLGQCAEICWQVRKQIYMYCVHKLSLVKELVILHNHIVGMCWHMHMATMGKLAYCLG